jgi:hypothetical protein
MSTPHLSHKAHKLTKKEQDLINRFNYYSESIQEAALHSAPANNYNETIQNTATFGSNEYHSFQMTRDSYHHQSLLERKTLSCLA